MISSNFIAKKYIKKENYTISSRIICGILTFIIVTLIYGVQEYRKEHYNFWFGVLPSFLASLAFPLLFVTIGSTIKVVKNKFISWGFITVLILTIYETTLWIGGRNFDIMDILFTLIGAIISSFIVVSLIPKIQMQEEAE